MKELLRKTFELIRDNPVLWAPYLVAEFLAIGLWRLRGLAEKKVFHWFMTGHSVLGGAVTTLDLDHEARAKASLAYTPIGLLSIFAVLCLFVIALAVTSHTVDAIGGEQKPNAVESLAAVAPLWRRVLLYTFKLLLAIGVVCIGVFGLVYLLLRVMRRQDLLGSPMLLPASTILGVGCLAWLMMPSTIRLLNPEAVGPITARIRMLGTIFAILVSEAGQALGLLASRLEKGMIIEFRWESMALSTLNSILANAPDVLLFVALAILASGIAGKASLQVNLVDTDQSSEPRAE